MGLFLMFLLFPIFTSSKFLFTLHLFWCLLFMLETLLQCLIILGCPFIFKSEILEWYWMLCVDSLNLWKDRFENRVINKVPQMCCRAFPPQMSAYRSIFWGGQPTSERNPLGLLLRVANILVNKQNKVSHCLICRFSPNPSVFSSGLHLLCQVCQRVPSPVSLVHAQFSCHG